MAHEGIQYEVMISYKWRDSKDFAERLQKYLQSQNMRVYRDETENEGGQVITEQWKKAIRTCQVFLPLLTVHYPQGTPEEEFFYNKDKVHKPLVPVIMEGFVVPTRYGIGDVLQIREEDYKENEELFLKKILDGVKKILDGVRGGIVRSEGLEENGGSQTVTPADFAQFKDPPEEADLMNFVGADCRTFWKEIGKQLKIKGADLDAIQLQTAGQPNAAMESMSEVFNKWHTGMTCEYSWKKLAEVLCSPTVDKPSQMNTLYSELVKRC